MAQAPGGIPLSSGGRAPADGKMPDAAGLVANCTGTHARAGGYPHRTRAPELFTPGEPCDIVAKEDGVIVSVTALEGIAKVQAGQTVKRVMCSFPAISSARKGKTAPYRPVARLSLRSTSRAAILFL